MSNTITGSALLCAAIFLQIPLQGCGRPLSGDNETPLISGLHAKIDYKDRQLTVRYGLSGKNKDSMTIRLILLDSNNRELGQTLTRPTGDIGFPVLPDPKRIIRLQIDDPETLGKIRMVRLLASDAHQPDVGKLLHDYDSSRLLANLLSIGKQRNLYSETSIKQLEYTRKIISQTFQRSGLVLSIQPFSVHDRKGCNVIGELRSPQGKEAPTLVVGAHYDTVDGSPGLDDNGTGVAALLEVATVLSKYSFRINIEFVAFDLEESIKDQPDAHGIEGSSAFVTRGGIREQEKIAGFINLDMLGYYSSKDNSQVFPEELQPAFPELYSRVKGNNFRGDFLLVISNPASSALSASLESIGAKYLPGLNIVTVTVPGNGESMADFRRSDHANFWDKGYQAISLGDGAFSRNPHYHTHGDSIQDINPRFFGYNTKLLLLAIAKQAEMENATVAVTEINTSNK